MHADQSTLFTGQPVLNQLLQHIPAGLVKRLTKKYKADRYCKTFFAMDHVVTMVASCFMRCGSLQELVTGLQANAHRLRHSGLKNTPRKSTLADANGRRTEVFFGELYHELHRLYYPPLPDSRPKKGPMKERVYLLDATTITLFSDVMHGTGRYALNGKKKGGAKAHVLMREVDDVPCFIDLTEGKTHDQHILPMISLPKWSILVFDMGYTSYTQWNRWHEQGIWWVTWLKQGALTKVLETRPVSAKHKAAGILSDELLRVGSDKKNVVSRRVRYRDPKTGKELDFLTNNGAWAPTTVASIYKQRWDIELLFRRIKQNYPLRDFLGDSANAIKIQIWCSFIADLLLQVVQRKVLRKSKRKWSFSTIAGLVRIHLNNYIDLIAFLSAPERALLNHERPEPNNQNQLCLLV